MEKTASTAQESLIMVKVLLSWKSPSIIFLNEHNVSIEAVDLKTWIKKNMNSFSGMLNKNIHALTSLLPLPILHIISGVFL